MAEPTAPTAPKKKSNVTSTIERMQANRDTKNSTSQAKVDKAQQAYDADKSRGKHNTRDAKGKTLNAEKAAQKKEMARTNDTLEGAKFGAAVLGEDGLGRLGDDAKVQETLGRF